MNPFTDVELHVLPQDEIFHVSCVGFIIESAVLRAGAAGAVTVHTVK